MINFKFIGLFSVIFVLIIGGIYFGFLKFDGGGNFFSQISGVSGDDFKFVGEVELENNFISQNSGQNDNQNFIIKSAKKNKKTAIKLNENIVKVISGVAAPAATSVVVSSTPITINPAPIIENNTIQVFSAPVQEQNQEQIIVSSTIPVVIDIPVVVPVIFNNPPAVQPNAANQILISEIMVGIEGGADYEFIELYNPTSQSINLTGWSIKKKSSTGSESTLVSSSRLEGKIIPANKYYLLANEGGYSGSVFPDIFWPKSYALAYSNNAAIVYNANSELVEEVSWTEIPKGQSIERVSWDSNEFKIQSNPNPQNSQNN